MNRILSGCFSLLPAIALAAACGSSTTTSATSPSTVSRCAVTIGSTSLTIPADGGTGQLAITTARECAWTANPTATWLTLRGGASGQGDGSVEYVAAANPDPTARGAAIEINDQRTTVTQAAGACTLSLGASSAGFQPAGGTGTIDVRASSGQCPWTAVSDASWVTIRSGANGTGAGTVSFTVEPGGTTARTATILVAGLRFAIVQSNEACAFSVTPGSFDSGAAGGTSTFTVSAPAGCPWTAASNVDWAAVTQGSSGTGAGIVRVTVAATSGPARSGTVLIAGQSIAISQSPGCSFEVAPLTHTVPGAGGTFNSTISTTGGCSWNAATSAPWIVFTGATSGTGSGTLSFTVPAAAGAARSGSIEVAGRTIAVSQGAGCAFTLSPESVSVGASGGDVTVSVSGVDGCGWTASSTVSWITIPSGSSGTGSGTVTLHVEPTTSATRSASVTIAGQNVGVTQSAGCAIALSPTTGSLPAAGGGGSFAVSAGTGCTWTATPNDGWIAITGATSGTGNGTVQYAVSSSTSSARSGTIAVGGATFTLTQGSGCTFGIAPTTASVPSAGAAGTVTVTAPDGCGWSATSDSPWIHVTAGASGSGGGTVSYTADATTGGARSGALTIAGQTFTINQANACSFSIAPAGASVAAEASTGTVAVSAGDGCAWSASSRAGWLTVTAGSAGGGNGTVAYSVAANTGPGRTGELSIAGRTFTVTQAGGCSIGIAPASTSVPAGGASGTIAVTAAAGCDWTASSDAGWITVTSGAGGSGDGSVAYAVAPNSGGARTGTVTIGGRRFTVTQDGNCSIAIAPGSAGAPAAGGTGTVTVTAGTGCGWAAAGSVDWITVTAGASGSGNGTVGYAVAANGGGPRAGTLTIGGQTFTVNQDGTCGIGLTPSAVTLPATGGSASVAVSAPAGCPWTSATDAAWLSIDSGTSGSGDGSLTVSAGLNSGGERAGTVIVGGQALTVTQQAIGCTYAVSPPSRKVPGPGGPGMFNVTTGDTCPWVVTSTVPWISIVDNPVRVGSGKVDYVVERNDTGAGRTGTISVMGQVFTVEQDADRPE